MHSDVDFEDLSLEQLVQRYSNYRYLYLKLQEDLDRLKRDDFESSQVILTLSKMNYLRIKYTKYLTYITQNFEKVEE